MSVKIRLSRFGRKRYAYYHIVVADSRAPRDGKFIDRIGSYNPNTNPATIDLNFDKALDWLQKGAQPTDTCRAILSYKGVLLKKHLQQGVQKGAITQEQADAKFNTWAAEKDSKIKAKIDSLRTSERDANKKRVEAESKIREARAEEIAKRNAERAAAEAAAKAEAEAAKAAEAATDAEAAAETEATAEA
ncbi:MAG: 30S ribosomal protein S16 [Bacteroidales bacterium]|nr:30S ribosomal protein S16 [Bacteroidales bacterium]